MFVWLIQKWRQNIKHRRTDTVEKCSHHCNLKAWKWAVWRVWGITRISRDFFVSRDKAPPHMTCNLTSKLTNNNLVQTREAQHSTPPNGLFPCIKLNFTPQKAEDQLHNWLNSRVYPEEGFWLREQSRPGAVRNMTAWNPQKWNLKWYFKTGIGLWFSTVSFWYYFHLYNTSQTSFIHISPHKHSYSSV